MSSYLQIFRESLRNNFGPTVFMIVVGVIAFVFISFLILDYVKTLVQAARRRKRHRENRGAGS